MEFPTSPHKISAPINTDESKRGFMPELKWYGVCASRFVLFICSLADTFFFCSWKEVLGQLL